MWSGLDQPGGTSSPLRFAPGLGGFYGAGEGNGVSRIFPRSGQHGESGGAWRPRWKLVHFAERAHASAPTLSIPFPRYARADDLAIIWAGAHIVARAIWLIDPYTDLWLRPASRLRNDFVTCRATDTDNCKIRVQTLPFNLGRLNMDRYLVGARATMVASMIELHDLVGERDLRGVKWCVSKGIGRRRRNLGSPLAGNVLFMIEEQDPRFGAAEMHAQAVRMLAAVCASCPLRQQCEFGPK